MSEKNKKKEEAVLEETVVEESGEEPIVIPSDSTSEMQKAVDEYKELAQRIQAEFDNYRKRNNESVRIARNDGINDVICAMLDVIDNLERGIKAVSDEGAKSGMELIYKQMLGLLTKFDVTEIEALGAEFDPNLHHAIAQCDNEEQRNTVVEVYQKGYKRKEKVLRPSMVKVTR